MQSHRLEQQQEDMRRRMRRKGAPKYEKHPILNSNDMGVYIVGNNQHHWYKIGWSTAMANRIHSFALPFPLDEVHCFTCSNPQKVESTLHKLFDIYRLESEWFSLQPNVLKMVLMQAEEFTSSHKMGLDLENNS